MHLGGQMEKGKEVGKNGVTIEIDIVLINCVENKGPKASCQWLHLGGQMEKGKEVGKNGVTIEIHIVLTNCVENIGPKASCWWLHLGGQISGQRGRKEWRNY